MSEIAFDASGYLIDLDGTLISGRVILPDARWLLQQVEGRYMLVSNNAEHTPDQLSRMLKNLGLQIAPSRIILAGTTAIDCIAQTHPGASTLLLGSAALRNYARRKGLRMHQERPDIVLVTRDRNFSYAKIAAAAEALHDGAHLFVAAPDVSHPSPSGKPVPETGALAAAILACAGPCDYTIIGKPERVLFEMACERLGVSPTDAVMIGDNPQTDGLGASRLGMRYWQVDGGLLRQPMRQAAE